VEEKDDGESGKEKRERRKVTFFSKVRKKKQK